MVFLEKRQEPVKTLIPNNSLRWYGTVVRYSGTVVRYVGTVHWYNVAHWWSTVVQ